MVADECAVHKDPQFIQLIISQGSHLVFLPPYLPDLNPVRPRLVCNLPADHAIAESMWCLLNNAYITPVPVVSKLSQVTSTLTSIVHSPFNLMGV